MRQLEAHPYGSYPPRISQSSGNGWSSRATERLSHLMKHLSQIIFTQDFEVVQPQPVPTSRILAALISPMWIFCVDKSRKGIVPLDPDTWMSPASSARLSSLPGRYFLAWTRCSIAPSRESLRCAATWPPCGTRQRHGICLLNSVAIAAIAALDHAEVERVAIQISTFTTAMARRCLSRSSANTRLLQFSVPLLSQSSR